MNQDKDSVCCNHNCNQGRTCPVRLGTHKPAEAVHQIDEPQADALLELAAYRFTVANREARIAELESQLEAIGAGGVEPLRKRAAQAQDLQLDTLKLARDRLADMLEGDDGQAWKEARKAMPIIDAALAAQAKQGG